MALDLCSAGQPQPYIENLELSYQRTTRLYYHIQQYHHIFSYTLISCQLCIHSIRLSSHLIRVICFAHSISQFTALTSRQKYNMLYQKTCLQRSLRTYTCLSLPSITKMTHCTQWHLQPNTLLHWFVLRPELMMTMIYMVSPTMNMQIKQTRTAQSTMRIAIEVLILQMRFILRWLLKTVWCWKCCSIIKPYWEPNRDLNKTEWQLNRITWRPSGIVGLPNMENMPNNTLHA